MAKHETTRKHKTHILVHFRADQDLFGGFEIVGIMIFARARTDSSCEMSLCSLPRIVKFSRHARYPLTHENSVIRSGATPAPSSVQKYIRDSDVHTILHQELRYANT